MRKGSLHPDQLITLNDYPVHSEQVLKLYHRMFWKGAGNVVPPCPVLHRSMIPSFISRGGRRSIKCNELFIKFLKRHPEAEYFMIDGSHKTTAAALCHQRIAVIIFQKDNDIKAARKLVEQGELLSLTTGGEDSIKAIIKTLQSHFIRSLKFETVTEKTARMVRGKIIPRYMIAFYKTKR